MISVANESRVYEFETASNARSVLPDKSHGLVQKQFTPMLDKAADGVLVADQDMVHKRVEMPLHRDSDLFT